MKPTQLPAVFSVFVSAPKRLLKRAIDRNLAKRIARESYRQLIPLKSPQPPVLVDSAVNLLLRLQRLPEGSKVNATKVNATKLNAKLRAKNAGNPAPATVCSMRFYRQALRQDADQLFSQWLKKNQVLEQRPGENA